MGLNLHVFYFFTIFPWLEIGDKVATVVPLLFSSLLLKLDWSNYFFYHNLQRIADSLNVEIKRWVAGKEGNMRALLSSLQYVSSLISFSIILLGFWRGRKSAIHLISGIVAGFHLCYWIVVHPEKNLRLEYMKSYTKGVFATSYYFLTLGSVLVDWLFASFFLSATF